MESPCCGQECCHCHSEGSGRVLVTGAEVAPVVTPRNGLVQNGLVQNVLVQGARIHMHTTQIRASPLTGNFESKGHRNVAKYTFLPCWGGGGQNTLSIR